MSAVTHVFVFSDATCTTGPDSTGPCIKALQSAHPHASTPRGALSRAPPPGRADDASHSAKAATASDMPMRTTSLQLSKHVEILIVSVEEVKWWTMGGPS